MDRLLASPHYGERMAQHWLDLVRYAETDGFKADDLRPEAHRYRDYVIRSFNADLPYDRFVRQQLAGDELEPDNADAMIATGFLRLWPDEYNAANLEQRRQEILDDVTDTTGLAFLGLTFGCARCHDHKFDPIPQTDYYRLQAFFAPMRRATTCRPWTAPHARTIRTGSPPGKKRRKTSAAEMDALVAGKRQELRKNALMKFRAGNPRRRADAAGQTHSVSGQIALMAEKQMRPRREGRGREAACRQEEALSGTGAEAGRGRTAPAGSRCRWRWRQRRGPSGSADVPLAGRRLAQAEGGGAAGFPAFPRRRRRAAITSPPRAARRPAGAPPWPTG